MNYGDSDLQLLNNRLRKLTLDTFAVHTNSLLIKINQFNPQCWLWGP